MAPVVLRAEELKREMSILFSSALPVNSNIHLDILTGKKIGQWEMRVNSGPQGSERCTSDVTHLFFIIHWDTQTNLFLVVYAYISWHIDPVQSVHWVCMDCGKLNKFGVNVSYILLWFLHFLYGISKWNLILYFLCVCLPTTPKPYKSNRSNYFGVCIAGTVPFGMTLMLEGWLVPSFQTSSSLWWNLSYKIQKFWANSRGSCLDYIIYFHIGGKD